MSFLTLDIGQLLEPLLRAISAKPARIVVTFLVIFVLAMAAALGFPALRIPFAITAAVALFAMVALGSHVAGKTGSSSSANDVSGLPSASPDQRKYIEYLFELNADTHRRWVNGEFADPAAAEKHRGEVLEAVLAILAARLQSLGLPNASIVVVRRDNDDFLVRRIGGPLKSRLRRGQRCRPNLDLDDALRRYVPHCHHALIDCCGRQHALAVTADVELDSGALEEVRHIAYLYQTQYERLRLYQRTAELHTEILPA